MLKIVRATEDDIDRVAANLGRRTLEELRVFGYRDVEHIKENMLSYLESPWAYALRDGDETLAFMGGLEIEPGLVTTWLHVTDGLARVGKSATKMLRWFLAEQVKAHLELTIEIATASPCPKADTWIRLLGFKPYRAEGDIRYFRPVGSC
jgi:hypothetical protein